MAILVWRENIQGQEWGDSRGDQIHGIRAVKGFIWSSEDPVDLVCDVLYRVVAHT